MLCNILIIFIRLHNINLHYKRYFYTEKCLLLQPCSIDTTAAKISIEQLYKKHLKIRIIAYIVSENIDDTVSNDCLNANTSLFWRTY